jgi:hypothetical protein
MYEVQFIFCSLFLEEIEFFKYSVKQMYASSWNNCDVCNFFFFFWIFVELRFERRAVIIFWHFAGRLHSLQQ